MNFNLDNHSSYFILLRTPKLHNNQLSFKVLRALFWQIKIQGISTFVCCFSACFRLLLSAHAIQFEPFTANYTGKPSQAWLAGGLANSVNVKVETWPQRGNFSCLVSYANCVGGPVELEAPEQNYKGAKQLLIAKTAQILYRYLPVSVCW